MIQNFSNQVPTTRGGHQSITITSLSLEPHEESLTVDKVAFEANFQPRLEEFFGDGGIPGRSRLNGIRLNGGLDKLRDDLYERRIRYVSRHVPAIPGVDDSEITEYDEKYDEHALKMIWLAESKYQMEGLPKKYQTLRSVYFAMPYKAPNALDSRSLKVVQSVAIGGCNLDLDKIPHLLSVQTPKLDFFKIFPPYPLNKTDDYLYGGQEEIVLVPPGNDELARNAAGDVVRAMADSLADRFGRNLEKVYKNF